MSERGSEKMLTGRTLEKHHLQRLLELAETEGIELVEWFPRGIPVVDTVGGSFRVTRSQAANLLGRLIELEALRLRFDVFPYGIPNPEGFLVNFGTR